MSLGTQNQRALRVSRLAGPAVALLLATALPARLSADEATPATPAAPAAPAVQLPDDTGRSALEKTCLGCHPADRIVARRRTPDQWQEVMGKMMEQGAMATDEDLQSILDYLVRHFGEPATQ